MKFLVLLFAINLTQASTIYTPKSFTLSQYGTKEQVRLENLKGKKTLLNFWASWCTSCIEELPILHKLKKEAAATGYRFYAINAGDTKKKISKFIKRYNFNYDILLDKDRSVSKEWGVTNLPITIILDEKLNIIYSGTRPPAKLP